MAPLPQVSQPMPMTFKQSESWHSSPEPGCIFLKIFLRSVPQTSTTNWLKLLLKMKHIFHPWVSADLFLFTKCNTENLKLLFDSFHVTKLVSPLLFINNLFTICSLQVFWLNSVFFLFQYLEKIILCQQKWDTSKRQKVLNLLWFFEIHFQETKYFTAGDGSIGGGIAFSSRRRWTNRNAWGSYW